MQIDFNQRLKQGVIVADGAMGTMLQKAGIRQGECSEEWNLSHGEAIRDIHRQYIEAGADLIITNTFGGNPVKLKAIGLSEKMEEINITGVSLARKAIELSRVNRDVFIAGDIGPCGEFLEPIGTFTEKDLYRNFKAQAEALVKGGVDLIIIETMTDIGEAEISLKAAKESGLPVIVSMSFNKDAGGEDFHTMMGVSLEKMAERLSLAGADVIGVNCGIISLEMDEVIRRLRKFTQLPLMAEANAGLPKLVNGKTIYDFAPKKMGELGLRLKQAGAGIIGGCCGTTPAHIKAIVESVKK
jgi:5-methyltetrahydrofolate--homocysteine methyltransferase